VTPPSPVARRLRPPSWLEPRLVAGVLLVVVSVAAGARIVAAADRSVQVWALDRDVAAGTVLTAEDVRPARVRLFESAPLYLRTTQAPTGRSVSRRLGRGELLPAEALRHPSPGVVVAIPVLPENAPAVSRGQSIDVWAGTKDCGPELVLAAAPVQEVRTDRVGALASSSGPLQVVVRVGAADVERLLAALGAEATIRLVLLDGGPGAAVAGPPCVRSTAPRPPRDGGR
jgi:SAF domain-containing protein